MSEEAQNQPPQPTKAQQIFRKARPEHQEIIRAILREERDVQHLQRRDNIHTRLYEHIRRIIQ